MTSLAKIRNFIVQTWRNACGVDKKEELYYTESEQKTNKHEIYTTESVFDLFKG